jgi:hypothetical protein
MLIVQEITNLQCSCSPLQAIHKTGIYAQLAFIIPFRTHRDDSKLKYSNKFSNVAHQGMCCRSACSLKGDQHVTFDIIHLRVLPSAQEGKIL